MAGPEESIPPAPTTGHRRAATIEAVRFGWRGHLNADCWGPVRIYISGNPSVGGGAFGGTLELLYAQDGSQSAQITVPVATTPGRVTPVEAAVALPINVHQFTATLYNDKGRPVDSRTYRRGDSSMPVTIIDATPLVIAIADRSGISPSVAKAFPEPGLRSVGAVGGINIPSIGQPVPTRNPFDDLACVTVTADDLPESWAAYDGVTAVVINADEIAALPPARLAALLTWVRSGGCIVARTGTNSAGLARLFESTPGRAEVAEPGTVTPGAELERLFADPTPIEKDGKLADINASLHTSVQGRLLAIGERSDPDTKAWRVRWSPRDATRVNGVETSGLLAEGPMGFGWVVVLGIDPAHLGTGADDAAGRIAWRDALRSGCAELAARSRTASEYSWGVRGSGADHSSRLALRSALNALSDVPALGDGVFIVIVLCLLALAAAIGPFDALFLGHKKKRQLSFATALGWIAIASVLAAALPPLLRGGESKLRRLRVVDVLADPERADTLAWQSAVTTLFAGAGGPVQLAPTDAQSQNTVWFRGISPLFVQPFNSNDPLVRFATVQQEPPGASERGRVNRLDQQSPMRMGQWTFRTFMDQGPTSAASASSSIRLERAPANTPDSWLVRVPASLGTFVDGALRIGDSWNKLGLFGSDDANLTLHIEAGTTDWNARDTMAQSSVYGEVDFKSGVALELPGTRERSRALDARLASGEWAVVYLRLKSSASSLTCRRLTWAGNGEEYKAGEETIYRLVLPLGEARVPRSSWSVTLPKTVAPEEKASRKRRTGAASAATPPNSASTTSESEDEGDDDESSDDPMTDEPKTEPPATDKPANPAPKQEPKP